MKPHERRTTEGGYPYYKLAAWDPRSMTWRDGKRAFPTPEDARAGLAPGRYRISIVTADGREDLPPFDAPGA